MATPTRSRLRVRLGLLAVIAAATVVSVGGALLWAEAVDRDGAAADDEVRLDRRGDDAEPDPASAPLATGSWPAVELIDPDGTPAPLRSDGRPMVVNFWYSTCPPCARELADFADVHDDVAGDVRFVGVNPLDAPGAMARFAGDRGVGYELWRDPDAALADELGVIAYPTTVFVGADGRIVDQTGVLDDAELRASLAELWGVS